MLQHRPLFDTKVIEDFYSKKDGVPIKYVCTTELKSYGSIYNIFYRDTPHPEFGNKYFGITSREGSIYITNADSVEDLSFNCVEVDGKYYYSRGTHDFYTVGSFSIDGGRSYTRTLYSDSPPKITTFKVKDGEFHVFKV